MNRKRLPSLEERLRKNIELAEGLLKGEEESLVKLQKEKAKLVELNKKLLKNGTPSKD